MSKYAPSTTVPSAGDSGRMVFVRQESDEHWQGPYRYCYAGGPNETPPYIVGMGAGHTTAFQFAVLAE